MVILITPAISTSEIYKQLQEVKIILVIYYLMMNTILAYLKIKKFEDEKITSNILKTLYNKEGLDSPLFKVMFY